MFVHGSHAASQERERRGYQFFWPGGFPFVPNVVDFSPIWSWHAPFSSVGMRIRAGSGGNITPGVKGRIEVPFDCFIYGSTLVADQAGSVDIAIYRTSYASLPHQASDTITPLAASRPGLSGAQTFKDLFLKNWSRVLRQGDWLTFEVLSTSGIGSL